MISSLIFVVLAGFFTAVMDTLAHHFDTSVFKKRNTAFWNPLHPDNDKVSRIFSYPLDAWHLAKSAMIICFLLAGGFAWYWSLGLGFSFVIVFNWFYNKVLR